jgi:hypothetical protein
LFCLLITSVVFLVCVGYGPSIVDNCTAHNRHTTLLPLLPSPPFSTCSIDLAANIMVRLLDGRWEVRLCDLDCECGACTRGRRCSPSWVGQAVMLCYACCEQCCPLTANLVHACGKPTPCVMAMVRRENHVRGLPAPGDDQLPPPPPPGVSRLQGRWPTPAWAPCWPLPCPGDARRGSLRVPASTQPGVVVWQGPFFALCAAQLQLVRRCTGPLMCASLCCAAGAGMEGQRRYPSYLSRTLEWPKGVMAGGPMVLSNVCLPPSMR